jgi:hypothetical protein
MFSTFKTEIQTRYVPLTAIAPGARTIYAQQATVVRLRFTPADPEPAPVLTVQPEPAEGLCVHHVSGPELGVYATKAGNWELTITSGEVTQKIQIVAINPPPDLEPQVAAVPVTPIPADAISVFPADLTISPYQQSRLGAVVEPCTHNQGPIDWVSSDPAIVEVTQTSREAKTTEVHLLGDTALIRGLRPGAATITASVDGKTFDVTVLVA